jgi:Ca-activated chloride channel family protein
VLSKVLKKDNNNEVVITKESRKFTNHCKGHKGGYVNGNNTKEVVEIYQECTE